MMTYNLADETKPYYTRFVSVTVPRVSCYSLNVVGLTETDRLLEAFLQAQRRIPTGTRGSDWSWATNASSERDLSRARAQELENRTRRRLADAQREILFLRRRMEAGGSREQETVDLIQGD